MAPFIYLIQKDQPFSWAIEVDNAFQYLKVSFTTTPFFTHVEPSKLLSWEMDDFDFAIGTKFSQLGEVNIFHPINFRSCRFFPTKINYKIHDKEPLWMPLRRSIIFFKKFNMKSLCKFKP